MRVAFVVGQFPVASKTFIINQITGLIDRGHQVDIYATQPEYYSALHLDIEKYNLLEHTYYERHPSGNFFSRHKERINILSNSFLLNPRATINALNIFRYGKQAAFLGLLCQASSAIQNSLPYDIIHCHFGENGLKGLQLREIRALQEKLIVTFHGFDLTRYINERGKAVYEKLFTQGDLFTPISNHWKQRLIELGCDENKIAVHRMGIDCSKFIFTPRTLSSDGRVRFVSVCRLVEKKGLEYGIRAVAEIIKENKNIAYTIIGDGPLKEELYRLIQDLEIDHAVKLLGWKPQQEVVEILKESDILLAPSVTSQDGDQEGIPVALMEAMAMGMPVVSTYHSGIPELIEDGVSGFLVPERDVIALAKKICDLVENSQIWLEMGHSGRKRVEDAYNIDRLNNQLIELYQELLTKY